MKKRRCADCAAGGVRTSVPFLLPRSRGWTRAWRDWLCPKCTAARAERKRRDDAAFWNRINDLAKQII